MYVPLCCWQISNQTLSKTLNYFNLYLCAVDNERFTNDDIQIEVEVESSTNRPHVMSEVRHILRCEQHEIALIELWKFHHLLSATINLWSADIVWCK